MNKEQFEKAKPIIAEIEEITEAKIFVENMSDKDTIEVFKVAGQKLTISGWEYNLNPIRAAILEMYSARLERLNSDLERI